MAHPLIDTLQEILARTYRIERELPGGGMSRVFLATEVALKRQVVIKVLPPDLVSHESTARFRREIEVTAQLQHPLIVPLLATGAESELLYYITPFVAGESLRARLASETRLSVDETLGILTELCDALSFAHARGIVHRDVKPGNVLLSDGHAVLADFGVARALETSAPPITHTEVRLGTPAYMAPERPVNEQADLYAVAVMGWEMLTGSVPGAAGTERQLVATLALEGAAITRDTRRLASAIVRQLSFVARDRYRSAAELKRALIGKRSVRDFRMSRLAASVVVAAVAIAGAVAVVAAVDRAQAGIDPWRYLVVPFDAPASDGRIADSVATGVSEALDEWREVNVVPRGELSIATGLENGRLSLERAAALARDLHAGWLIMGEVRRDRGRVRVDAATYDATRARLVRRATATVDSASPIALRGLASALLRDGSRLPWRDASDRRPVSLVAWRAHDAGRAALDTGDLEGAKRSFREAVAADPDNAPSHVGLALAAAWSDDRTGESERSARRAALLASQLATEDSLLAVGLAALATHDYPNACASFRAVLKANTASVPALIGIGECESRDTVIVRLGQGYGFRGSFQTAATAYERALSGMHGSRPEFVYRRLAFVLPTESNRVRTGWLDNSRLLRAYPSLTGDTVTFVPQLEEQLTPATRTPALERNKSRLRRLLVSWVREAPQSAAAHRLLSENLEASGNIAESGAEDFTALGEIRRARALAKDSLERLRLSQIELRQLVKHGDWQAARALGDSVLAAHPHPSVDHAQDVAGIAALLGRTRELTVLLRELSATPSQMPRTSDGRPVEVAPPVALARASMIAAATMQVCPGLAESADRLKALVDAYYPPSQETRAARDAILAEPFSLAVPCLGASAVSNVNAAGNRLIAMQQALARSDRRALAAHFDTLRMRRRYDRPAAVTMDFTFVESWLLVAAGDSAAARVRLQQSLDGLADAGPYLLTRPTQAASLVHSMALYARLAAARRDIAEARRWAAAVVELWGGADAPLQPLVAEMRSIISAAVTH